MKTNSLLLALTVLTLPLVAPAQTTKTTASPIMAGKDIAVVPTESGKVRGYIHNGTYTFKGIPYAKADRFMAPPNRIPGQTCGVQ